MVEFIIGVAVGLVVGWNFLPQPDWVKEKLDLASVEASLDAQITEQKQPTKVTGLPW